jgi:hypothetical protein
MLQLRGNQFIEILDVVINACWHFIMLQERSIDDYLLMVCDQRLLAFHYVAGQWLKRLTSKTPQLILQASPTIEPLISKNSLNSEKLATQQ